MASSDWAAWVQAGGAIAALWISIRLARGDRRRQAAEKRARARTAALALYPLFLDAYGELAWIENQISRGCPLEKLGNNGPEEEDNIAFWDTSILRDELKASRPFLNDLAEAASAAQSAYLHLFFMDSNITMFKSKKADDGPRVLWKYSEEESAEAIGDAKRAFAKTSEAVDAMGKLFP